MKRSCVALVVLLASLFMFAMSNSPKEEPKQPELLGPYVEVQTGEGFITLDELHRIAINYYKFMFEEEHEWKGMKRNEGEGVIKNITPFKEENTILAYMVNYNPDGHVLIRASKNIGNPIDQNGSGTWRVGVDEGFVSSFDRRLHPVTRDGIHRLKKALDSGAVLTKGKDIEVWQKYNVPVENFHERANFDNDYHPPKWWLEKKKLEERQKHRGDD